ncbi:GNAT family N-acetyltransferase [Alkalihalobacterium alkalicellulosilyticum]|uniref:GNAT family N-acetyltransferase n=1 Tax=Alkalihalobacterium alkalicellulosilyticum TaxID=1912214 RepID=UPI000998D50C|nr:GNAT family N-acetyltransferase [Bacillus alkalicellulosilyticus]
MIQKLEKQDYAKVKDLLKLESEISNVGLNSVINGTNRGIVYVDNTEHPTTALIYVVGVILFLVGDPHNRAFNEDLNRLIDNELKHDFIDACGGTWFIGTSFDERWEVVLKDLFSERNYGTYFEYHFTFNLDKFLLNKKSSYSMHNAVLTKIDKQLLHDPKNEDIFTDFWDFWRSEDDFFKQGLGYCVVENNKVISVCFSSHVDDNKHEIYVMSLEEARNKGLATICCTAFIEDCIKLGLEPHWSTYETNTASVNLASRCGFQLDKKLVAFEFEL